ncbi:MAG: histidinol-phosphate transaminase [Nitrososphaeria archaeon]
MKIRAIFENFEPYEWEMSPQEIAEKAGISVNQVLRLDTNTSPFIPRKWLTELARELQNLPVNQYPDTKYSEITRAIADYNKVQMDNIVVTNGADEAIDLIAKTIIDCGDKVVLSAPTYSMFRITSQIAGAQIIEVSRKRQPLFADDVDKIVRTADKEKAAAVFLSNPNNPTGTFLKIEQIKKLAEKLECAVIVDEAYYEFCGRSAVGLIEHFSNVIVVRTLSKAFSLAGERIGYILANKWTVDKLNYVRPPNSLSVTSLKLGVKALSDVKQMKEWVHEIVLERERCFNALKSIDHITPYPSTANFILFKLSDIDASQVHQKLLTKGISIRNLSDVKTLENCLRVTIGSRKDNDVFLEKLKEIIEEEQRKIVD